jgi:hypothetical protein
MNVAFAASNEKIPCSNLQTETGVPLVRPGTFWQA